MIFLMQSASRQVFLYQDESGGWVAECPSLPGCNSQGDTSEEAVANIRAAIELFVSVLEELGEPVPADRADARLVTV
jgi:predicted RNase H-like HicB family nuclease